MRITYNWEGRPQEIVIGRDWIRPAAIVLIIVLILVVVAVLVLLLA